MRTIHIQEASGTLVEKAKCDVLVIVLDLVFPFVDAGIFSQLRKGVLDFTSRTACVDETTLTQNKGDAGVVGD
jgi:hypothetical protein